ncbi:MAG: hypothetical protein J1F35_05755 [Erysipelotrichales bacterium]|nr:hypothetical protein [Erysipelotrichales bacterium]
MIKIMSKCQKNSIEEQYKNGIRQFDLRIAFILNKDKIHEPIFCHGIIEFRDSNIENILKFLSSKNDAYCRIILEKGDDTSKYFFELYVTQWLKEFPTLKIIQIISKKEK